MMRRAHIVLCLAALIVVLAVPGYAQDKGQIFGQVTRTDGSAISGVTVTVCGRRNMHHHCEDRSIILMMKTLLCSILPALTTQMV